MRPDAVVPKQMRALQRDVRGYPIPFIVFRDTDGKPHFTVNDSGRQRRCLREKRCPICGSRLPKELWFVGGPQSAFHVNGCYMDTAMHHACMTYALMVCPYLAMGKYLGRIDAGTLDQGKCPNNRSLFVDYTQDANRPSMFVAVMSTAQAIQDNGVGVAYVRPRRPYEAVEYWRDGNRLSDAAGIEVLSQLGLK